GIGDGSKRYYAQHGRDFSSNKKGDRRSEKGIGGVNKSAFVSGKKFCNFARSKRVGFMKKLAVFYFALILGFSAHYSQPDLTLNYMNVSNNSIMRGHLIKVQVSVKNTGNTVSGYSSMAFWISTTTGTTSSSIFLTSVSLPSIASNSTYSFQVVYPVPYSVNLGSNYLVVYIDEKNVVSETNESNNYFYYPTILQVFNDTSGYQHLPYPVLLVHGLSSSDQTWDNFIQDVKNILGWTFGAPLDFCLNQDGNTSTAVFSNDFHDYTNMALLSSSGDFYAINFDVDNTGTPHGNNVQSNQSAIFKQGYAVRNAVQHILQKTGKKKVILLGHSMGGLASREYVQNPIKYQSDNQHHVAKIITLGTPHGGSNAGPAFSPLTPDGRSEAVRDLRTSYFYSNNPGVFLFGGLEDLGYMDDQLCCYFYNADVN
ncbi:MAG: alpha/beta fold hydrolase, partial [Bacteroidetes bacterium]